MTRSPAEYYHKMSNHSLTDVWWTFHPKILKDKTGLPEPKRRTSNEESPPKKFHMPDGVPRGFVTAGRMDEEIVPKVRGKKASRPVYPSEENVLMPPLQHVVLDENRLKSRETISDGLRRGG